MKIYNPKYSDSFSTELEEIIRYKILNNHANAKDFYRKFLEKVERVKHFPFSAPLAPEYYPRLRAKGCRYIHFNIFYTIKGDEILFHRIIHAARKSI